MTLTRKTPGEPLVLISVLVLALYARQLYTGLRFYRGRARIGGHGGSGRWFLGLRTANLVTSLFVSREFL
jgi:hypothetical protein